MKEARLTSVALLLLLLDGCAGTASPDVAPPPIVGDQTKTGPCIDQPGGWCDFVREAAVRGWLYAQLSNNAYRADKGGQYVLPPTIMARQQVQNDGYGFAYQVFDRFEGQDLRETIIAFRGTEFTSIRDWVLGNLAARQNSRGLTVAVQVRAQLDAAGHPDTPITVTGHSLGGAIAHYVSLHAIGGPQRDPDWVKASIVFNNSPNYSGQDQPVPRLAIVEFGEVLKFVRAPGPEATQTYVSLNCSPGLDFIGDHSIRPLADCLTWIASLANDPGAKASMRANPGIGKPAGQLNNDPPDLKN